MRKWSVLVFAVLSLAHAAAAQTLFESWIFNLDGTTLGHYTYSGGGSGNARANISKLQYNTSYVYVSAYGIPGYTMNFPEPRYPGEQTYIFKIPRTAVEQTGTKTTLPTGTVAFLVNGVPVFHPGDGLSWDAATSSDKNTLNGGGDGVWNRNAVVQEADSYDTCLGHTSGTSPGKYHHHQNPKCLRSYFGDTGSTHSPILGWAFDGVPIYGPYGYSSALDSTSGIRRMVSGYTARTDLGGGRPNGPSVDSTRPLGFYLEDYEYTGAGDLDYYNGRFCVTPEYPNGTYAYFVTIDANGDSAYPYILGRQLWGTVVSGMPQFNSSSVTVPGDAVEYQPSCPVTVTPSQNSAMPSTSMTASVPDSGTGSSYSWSITNGSITAGSSSRTVTFTTSGSGLTTTITATVRTPHGCKNTGSANITTSSFATPANFTATLTSATDVSLSWSASAGATQYVVYRRTPLSGGWVEVGTSATTAFSATSLAASSAFLYCVQAANADRSIVSTQSLPDFVTTYGYTDNPVTAGTTLISAQHFTELRSAIEALDSAIGLTPPTWTDTSLTGVSVKTTHVTELRSAINSFLTALLLSSVTFTDSTLTAGTTLIGKTHLSQLRAAVKGYCSATNCE
ncbi:MAG TPA: YHYH protein [Thermoanaerobaculia bacterium]|nr:YHYH protein [Thermoanaerobaculia bacterium]